jgi:PAS domain S-box-containing protein
MHFEVETVSRLSEAITRVGEAPFDIVLLDLGLPDSQGLETLNALLKPAGEIPIVVLTGLADDVLSVEAVDSGAQDYLVKGKIDGRTLFRILRYSIGRKRQERALRQSEERYRAVTQTATDAIISADGAGNIMGWNLGAEKIFGYSEAEVIGRPATVLMPSRFHERHSAGMASLQAGGEHHVIGKILELEGVRKDGVEFPIELSLSSWDVAEGRFYTAIIRDVTDRKRTEELLRKSESDLTMAQKVANVGSWSWHIPSNRLIWSDQMYRIFGLDKGKISGDLDEVISKAVHPGDRDAVMRINLSVIRDKKPRPMCYRVIWPNGEERTVWAEAGELLLDETGNPEVLTGIVKDITEQKRTEAEKERLQAQLQQAQKMEAVGRLAGGVAHDFNNLLTVITGYSELLLQKVGKESPMHRELEEIQRAGMRASSLTQQLLAFSRKQVIEPKVLDLNLLVADLGKMLARLIGENVDLKIVRGKNLEMVKVDPVQFDQVLINLAVNAKDAMPDGGTLLIETVNVELDEEYCAQRPYEIHPGRYVRLVVSDTGHGMTKEISQQIFEPFFTTKAMGKGTGLGLSMVYGAVKQAGGSIEVYSEVGIGTTFQIYLPRVEGDAVKPGEVGRPAVLPKGTETVLVVEDEEVVRNMNVRILTGLGYKILQARNGADAIAVAQKYGDRIDLLLTDVVMPGMHGGELATQLVLHYPEMKVLFTSGYTDDAISQHGVLAEGLSFIGKPYTPSSLARKVREVLDES